MFSWLPLCQVKESNPVKLAMYTTDMKLENEAAFKWWINKVLRKKERVIKQVCMQIPRKGIKFGMMIPSSVDEAFKLDKTNGNNLWEQAFEKELKNMRIASNF